MGGPSGVSPKSKRAFQKKYLPEEANQIYGQYSVYIGFWPTLPTTLRASPDPNQALFYSSIQRRQTGLVR